MWSERCFMSLQILDYVCAQVDYIPTVVVVVNDGIVVGEYKKYSIWFTKRVNISFCVFSISLCDVVSAQLYWNQIKTLYQFSYMISHKVALTNTFKLVPIAPEIDASNMW